MQIGIDSFAAAISDPATGLTLSPVERMHHLLEEIELADRIGLDVFGIGEHHRAEFLDSAQAVILGAAAARTQRIRLTSAVTVLSAADPVRVFEEFATRANTRVTWSGKHRSPLTGQGVFPRPAQDPLPIWIGVGGTPTSFVRAG